MTDGKKVRMMVGIHTWKLTNFGIVLAVFPLWIRFLDKKYMI